MGARLTRDSTGRLVAVITTPTGYASMGTVLYVLGNEIGSGLTAPWAFTGTRSGRRNTVTKPRRRNADALTAAGSTSGSVKLVRHLLTGKMLRRELDQTPGSCPSSD